MDSLEEKFGVCFNNSSSIRMDEGSEKTPHRYLTDEEAKPLVNCFICKNCLPPFFRENGKICKLERCNFEPA